MIFNGNATGVAEGGKIQNAFIGVNGKAKKAYLAFVGDENGKAKRFYEENREAEATVYSVSSLEEFRELAQADPYGYFKLQRKQYRIAEVEGWTEIENFYGTLDGGYSRIGLGSRALIGNNYGIIKNVEFRFDFGLVESNHSAVINNFGRVTHCYFLLSLQNSNPGIFDNKPGGIVDYCMGAILKSYPNKKRFISKCPLVYYLRKGGIVYSCFSVIDLLGDTNEKRYAIAAVPYSGYEKDPELKENVRYNYARISDYNRTYNYPCDFQIKAGLCEKGWWIREMNLGFNYKAQNAFYFQKGLEGIDYTQISYASGNNGLSGDWLNTYQTE